MKNDPGLDAVRSVRLAISHEFGNDPERLVAYYIEMQSQYRDRPLLEGPGARSLLGTLRATADPDKLGDATSEPPPRR